MRKRYIYDRPVDTIVQQVNTVSTKQLLKDIADGKPMDMNPGSLSRSFDFPDGNVDFDTPLLDGFESLIDQHLNASRIVEHFNPPSSSSSSVASTDVQSFDQPVSSSAE